MPNTKPPMDSPEGVRALLEKAASADAAVYTAACVTKGMQEKGRTDLEALKAAGAIAISDDGVPVGSSRCLLEALEKAQKLGLTLTAHCEDMDLARGGKMNDGPMARELGLPGVPAAAEDSGTARELVAAAAYRVAIHICHVDTKTSVALIRDAKTHGVKCAAETAPITFPSPKNPCAAGTPTTA